MLLRFGGCRQCFQFSGLQWTSIKHNSSFSNKNYYQVLQVQPSSNPKQIKDNFYKLSKEFHPDVNKDDPIALARFKEVVEAYEVLSSPDEKQKYDNLYGFRPKPKAQINRVIRRFDRGGINAKGQYVDFDDPPVMRNIQYDLSPEKMEKVWKRYKERWNQTEEIERLKELKKKKVEFRKRIDERRANMKNMTPAEREDFLFNLRMLRTDEGVTGRSDDEIRAAQKEQEIKAAQKEKEKEASQKEQKNTSSSGDNNAGDSKTNTGDEKIQSEEKYTSNKSSETSDASSRSSETEIINETRKWFKREKLKINKNLSWKEELREQIKEKLKEEGDKMKTGRAKAEKFAREQFHPQVDEEELQKKVRDEYRRYQEDMFDFGEDEKDDKKREKKMNENFNPREDPLFYGMNKENPANMKDWINTSYERSKETMEEIKTSRPFTYNQQSIKHGVVSNYEVNFGTRLAIGSAIIILTLFTLEHSLSENYDDKGADFAEEIRQKKIASKLKAIEQ